MHLKRLNFVRRARALGFSLAEVRKLLRLADQRRRPCAEVRVVAEMHLEDVKAKITDLRRMERVLRETVVRCKAGGGSTLRDDRCAVHRNGAAQAVEESRIPSPSYASIA
jgi:DNA-binding transcriptional MerR regulator